MAEGSVTHREACAALLAAIEAAWRDEKARLLAAHPGRKDLHRRHKEYRVQERYIRSKATKARARDAVQDRKAAEDRTEALLAQYQIPRVYITGIPPATDEEMRKALDWETRQAMRGPDPLGEYSGRRLRRPKRRYTSLFGQGEWYTDGTHDHDGGNLRRQEMLDRARPERLVLDARELRLAERRISSKITKYTQRLRTLAPGTTGHARLTADLWTWRCDLARARDLLGFLGSVQEQPPGRTAERARARELHAIWAQQQRAARALPTRAEQRAALAIARAAWEEARQRDAHGRATARANAKDARTRARAEQRALAQRDRQAAAQAARRRPQATPEPAPVSWDLVCAF